MRNGLLLIVILWATTCPVTAAERPNLVFMIADDCTYLDMSVYGGQAKTPHLEKLAANGMQFSRCFQAAPMCSPTRHNIYTGIYPVKSGAWPNHTRVYPGTRSIAHYLKDAGYRVALSGKTHINPRESFPFEYSGEFRSASPAKADCYPTIEKLMVESKRDGNPFCLFACSNEPHSPYNKGDASQYPPDSLKLPPSWVDTDVTREQYSKYLAEITYFDAQCGALLKRLDKHGLSENTLVMAVSEQGSSFPFAKWTCFELGLASGMIVRWPGKVEPGSTSDALVEYTDVAPTFLAAAGLQTPKPMDGSSFLPVLLGEQQEHKKYTFGIHTTKGIINGSDAFAIRSCGTKKYRYIRNLHPDTEFSNAVTRKGEKTLRSAAGGSRELQKTLWGTWLAESDRGNQHAAKMVSKYIHRPAEELYDVEADPHCLKNLIEEPSLRAVKSELSAQLERWMKSQGDQGIATEQAASSRQGKGNKQKNPKKQKNRKKNAA